MHILFPPIKPYSTHSVKTPDGHELYAEESGNPQGIPVLFVHGGPGGGSQPDHRRFFDPSWYRIVLFDQRGCGHSSPCIKPEDNTTSHLIEDIETLRNYLSINEWVLFGTSWGSALSVLYAQAYPSKVKSLILCGITLCRDKELNWLYQEGGASRVFPEAWADFIAHIPENEHHNLLKAYYDRLHGSDELARMGAAKAWAQWHAICGSLQPNPHRVSELMQPHLAISLAKTQTHYFMNKAFLKPNQLLNEVDKLNNLTSIIIHGRYDVLCPVDNAYALHRVWPGSELQIVRDAGHTSSDPGNVNALVTATNQIAQRFNE
jgi:proline iminopeptidase